VVLDSILTFAAFALVVVVILLMGPAFIYFCLSYLGVSVNVLGFEFKFRVN